MKFVAVCLCVTVPILFSCNAAVPEVSLTHLEDASPTGPGDTIQLTCVATCLPYLQWFYYNQSDDRVVITEYSLNNISNNTSSFPLNLTILESSGLSCKYVEVTIVNAVPNTNSPLMGDYESTLIINMSSSNWNGDVMLGCGTPDYFNETLIHFDMATVSRMTVWNIVLTVFGVLLWLVAAMVTIAGPGTMCVWLEWWHGMYICQVVSEVFLLIITAILWIAFGATVGNMKSYSGEEFVRRRNDLCLAAFIFSVLSLLWILMAVTSVHLLPQCRTKTTDPVIQQPALDLELEVDEEMCDLVDGQQGGEDSKTKSCDNI